MMGLQDIDWSTLTVSQRYLMRRTSAGNSMASHLSDTQPHVPSAWGIDAQRCYTC